MFVTLKIVFFFIFNSNKIKIYVIFASTEKYSFWIGLCYLKNIINWFPELLLQPSMCLQI